MIRLKILVTLVMASFVAAIPSAHADTDQICSTNLQETLPGVLTTIYLDRFHSGSRQQVVSFSDHIGASEMELLLTLQYMADDITRYFDRRRKNELRTGIEFILQHNEDEIERLRQSVNRLQEIHRETPFSYIGVESPAGEQMLARQQLLDVAVDLRANLTRKMGDRLSEQQIDDLLLLLLGDEDYLLLPGNAFADIPRLPTEDPRLHEEFRQGLEECSFGFDQIALALEGTRYEARMEQIYSSLDLSEGAGDLSEFRRQTHQLADELIQAGALHPGSRSMLTGLLRPCEVYFSRDRDIWLARAMTEELPEELGLIFRGTGHRTILIEEFRNRCEGTASGTDAVDEESNQGEN